MMLEKLICNHVSAPGALPILFMHYTLKYTHTVMLINDGPTNAKIIFIDEVQGGPSGRGKPPVDSVPTVLAAAGPLL